MIPNFSDAVNKKTLTARQNEKPEEYKLRQQIQQAISEILKISAEGKTVPGQKVVDLRQLLSDFDPQLIQPGVSGDLLCAWHVLFDILELSPLVQKLAGQYGIPMKLEWYTDRDVKPIRNMYNRMFLKVRLKFFHFHSYTQIQCRPL